MTQLETAPAGASGAIAEPHADHLRLVVGEGPALLFHWFWLRHNAPEDVHPTTRERVLDAREVPLTLRPASVHIDGSRLAIDWGGQTSTYEVAWLVAHAYARETTPLTRPPSDVPAITLHGARVARGPTGPDLDAIQREALEAIEARGIVVVRGAGLDTEALLAAFGRGGLRVRGTHFGRIEDLRTDNTTNENTDQLGYTDAPVELHTDQPFLEDPPRYQMLHAIRAAHEGGESVLVDARAATRYLRAVDSDAYRILTTTPVTFHRKQKAFEKTLVSPLLAVDDRGELLRVRHSYFTFAPFQLPFERMEPFYRAYQRFARIVHEPAHQWRFLLEPGDFVLYDNHRLLHARTGFRGPRWVRGVYFDAEA